MERQDFDNGIKELYQYFRIGTFPLKETIDRWHEKVKWIPSSKLPLIVSEIENSDSLPRNIPNLFIAVYKKLPGRPKQYDPVEDFDFPMDYLWKALDVLKDNGETAFIAYCDEVNMPKNDRARVLAKYKVAYTYKDVQSVAESIG